MAIPDPSDPLPDRRDFEAALGRMIIAWNNAEGMMRSLLIVLARGEDTVGSLKINILTAELGNVGLEHALNSFAENILDDKAGAAVKHAVSFLERLRGYRNYYGHGISYVMDTPDLGTIGPVRAISAKGKLVENRERVTVEKLHWLSRECTRLATFAINILGCFDPLFGGDGPELPELPSLPQKLEKTAIYFRELFPPTKAAQG